MKKEPKDIILNSKTKDSGAKIIFGDNGLCAEFIRDYLDIPYASDIKAEDIEDVSEQFVTLFEEARYADVVKRINVKGDLPFFFISLFEHKSKLDYNVAMQIFRYMVFIWDAYEKEMDKQQKGIAKRADFKYPPIIPIVYYEGSRDWTVPKNFISRIQNGSIYERYIPDFEYCFVPLKEYSNEKLMNQGDGISLLMMINKLQSSEDIESFRKLSLARIEEIASGIPEYQRNIIADVFLTALLKMNMPVQEALGMVGKVKEKKMAELFGDMEEMDIQAERAKTAAARAEAKKAVQEAEERVQKAVQEAEERVQKTVQEAEERAQKAVQEAEEKAQEAEEKAKEIEKRARELEIEGYIEALQEFGITQEIAVSKLVQRFCLPAQKAELWIKEYWK